MIKLMVIQVLLMFIALSGCVSSNTYSSLLAEHNSIKDNYRKLKVEEDELKNQNNALTSRLAQFEQEKNMTVEVQENQKATMDEIIRELHNEIDDKTARISLMENQLRVELLDRLLFASGSADISPAGLGILGRIAPILKQSGAKEIRVIGHTNELPPRSNLKEKYPSNWELSTARASAVIRSLQWGFGIAPERMTAEGVAHYHPLESGSGKKARKANRAVEIILASERH